MGTLSIYIIVSLVPSMLSWHGFSNVDFHCWPKTANDANSNPYTTCDGVDVRWVEPPPDEIVVGESFNTTTELILHDAFYDWAVQKSIFASANGGAGITNGTEAKDWCESTQCPVSASANEENCCIHHMNIHSCPLEGTSIKNNLCGPWIPDDGEVITHSVALVGQVQQYNWTNNVPGLIRVGQTSLIAHFKIAGMSLAIEKQITVLPKSVCGDGTCSSEETCSTCRADCGRCPLEPWEISLIVLAIVLVSSCFVAFFLYHQYQRRKLFYDRSWIVNCQNVVKDKEPHHALGSTISRKTLDNGSVGSTMEAGTQLFAQTGVIDGKTVTLRLVNKKTFVLNDTIREEVRTLRTMDHPNVCKFVGGCLQIPHVCILMEYCPKGSLNDVLLNDDIPLSWSFRLSFASDISKGMEYLHSHDVIHQRLKSSNCVIDDRWTVKITDYGLETFRKNDFDDEHADMKALKTNIYLAPEMKGKDCGHTTETNVYAFAIILVEIATRNEPFGEEDLMSLPKNWRPQLPNLEKVLDSENVCPCPYEYCNLIAECWSNIPKERPRFDVITKRLRKINPNRKNPVDLMMSMMEKYSRHLESLVAERTKDLILEKQKTDKLLYSMLPRAVADNLRQGHTVEAESYNNCTIYFSDIVGFTTLCGGSTALQVVALLNKLYITFDEIIEKHDVYKVETIGDAYMVVSGVPTPTPTHAREIANMALDLVAACRVFKVPHKPEENIKIRVGLHSGCVCAGVVGLKMPRYCLFGDTVNTASRMESNGEAYKIHLSDFTYREICGDKSYDFRERGTIPVKGKGDMKTWWLLGKKSPTFNEKESTQSSLDHLIDKLMDEAQIINKDVIVSNENCLNGGSKKTSGDSIFSMEHQKKPNRMPSVRFH